MGDNNSLLKPYQKTAGALLFLAGSISLMGIITAETFYPAGYSTSTNQISDLGSTMPPNSVIHQPSAMIFNTTMIVTGIMILSGVYFVRKAYKEPLVGVPIGLLGLGALGAGIFPGNVTPWHGLFAMLTFFSGGFAAITSSKIVIPPFSYLGVIFGAIALFGIFSAVFFQQSTHSNFGNWRRRAVGCISDCSMVNWLWRLFAGHAICNKGEYGKR